LSNKPTHPFQPGLQGYQGGWFLANNTTAGTQMGIQFAVPTAASPANMGTTDIMSSSRRNRYQNVITTLNQEVGIKPNSNTDLTAWRGNAAGLGGFYFNAVFALNAWSATCRLFVGLAASATGIVISDTVLANTVGLWHDSTDGTSVFAMGNNGTTTTKGAALNNSSGTPNLAAGKSFMFELYAAPNAANMNYHLRCLDDNKTWGGFVAALPVNTAFMGPHAMVSNAANTPAATAGIDVMSCYVNTSPIVSY